MEFATEYILGKVITLTESIARRACQKAGEVGNNRFGPDGNRTLNDVVSAIEKETTQILDCLASQQQSKVDSAYQYIKFAMSDLQAWNDEPHPTPIHLSTSSYLSSHSSGYSSLSSISSRSTTSRLSTDTMTPDKAIQVHVGPLSMTPNFAVMAPTQSKYFRDAIWQLRQADEWATEAFNDKRNTKSYVRIEALNIRLFCRSLLDWDNKRLWFSKWRQVLEPFFSDRQFVRYCLGEQSFASKLFSDERAKPVSLRFNEMTKAMTKMIWGIVLMDPSLAPYAREFALFFDKNTTLAPDVKVRGEWAGLRTLHLSYYDLTDDIELKLCADRVVIRMYEFKAITPVARGQLWAIEHGGRMVSFDAKEPQSQTLVTHDTKRWLQVGYALQQQRIYATAEDDSYITVVDALTGKTLENERIELPPGPTRAYAYQMRVTMTGAILLCDKGNMKGYVMFPAEESKHSNHDRQWLPLKTGDYQAVLQGVNKNEVIGLKLQGYFLHADVIKKVSKNETEEEAFVGQNLRERLYLPNEPMASLISVSVDENVATSDLCCTDSLITIACQTHQLNYMITLGVKMDEHKSGVDCFKVKDVSSFDTKYTDWSSAREMVEADGKLYILFR